MRMIEMCCRSMEEPWEREAKRGMRQAGDAGGQGMESRGSAWAVDALDDEIEIIYSSWEQFEVDFEGRCGSGIPHYGLAEIEGREAGGRVRFHSIWRRSGGVRSRAFCFADMREGAGWVAEARRDGWRLVQRSFFSAEGGRWVSGVIKRREEPEIWQGEREAGRAVEGEGLPGLGEVLGLGGHPVC